MKRWRTMRPESPSRRCCATTEMPPLRPSSLRHGAARPSAAACAASWRKTVDSATRNFLALVAVSTVLLAESACVLVAYVLLPLLGGSHPLGVPAVTTAIMLGGLLGASVWSGI